MNQAEILNVVNQTVNTCTKFFQDMGWVATDWQAKVKTSFAPSRRRSWGGRRNGMPFISLSLRRYTYGDCVSFCEYPSFADDPEIGSVKDNTLNALRALIIHEMCHAAQYTVIPAKIASSFGVIAGGKSSRGHGDLWKNLYRASRNCLLNGKSVSVPKVGVIEPIKVPSKRQAAINLMKQWNSYGYDRKTIIERLVRNHGYSLGTATTYSYIAIPA